MLFRSPLASGLAMMRLAQTKRVKDPETGKIVLERTSLVTRAKLSGMNDETLLKMATKSASLEKEPDIDPRLKESLLGSLPEGFTFGDFSQYESSRVSSHPVLFECL